MSLLFYVINIYVIQTCIILLYYYLHAINSSCVLCIFNFFQAIVVMYIELTMYCFFLCLYSKCFIFFHTGM